MKQTLLLESVRGETRLAVIEENRLCELYIHRPGLDGAAGSIVLGRVENAVPGMNAAFVDIGAQKNGFLAAADIPSDETRIEKLVRPGQDVLVQVSKAQSGQKGHRLTARLTLPGRTMALLPEQKTAGVSKKIADPAERERLAAIARELTAGTDMGVIIRTAALGADAGALKREYDALMTQWRDIERRAACAVAPVLFFDNDSLPLRCARDMLNADVETVWVDGEEVYKSLMAHAEILAPELAGCIQRHEGQTPLFDLYRVDAQMDEALRKHVWLRRGGSLVIEETEAMTVIDVNTGKYTGSADVEETIFKTNCEAAAEIARQLRLRNIGGIIVVDFIDMAGAARNEELLSNLRELAKRDRSRLTVVGMTGLGLIEMTRKKDRRPLSKQLLHTCSACGGDGAAPSHETTARRIVRDIWRRRRRGEANPLLVETAEPVVKWLKTIGVPEGGAVYARAGGFGPGEYQISPADASRLPEGSRLLK